MIKRLRIQFVCVTMALTTVLLLTIMSLICYNTWYEMDHAAHEALRKATFEPWQPGGMGDNGFDPNYPCFVLTMDPRGQLEAAGHAYYDLSNQDLLMDIFHEAQATGKTEGYLENRRLQFVKIEVWKLEQYVFTNISRQLATLRSLYVTCIICFGLAMGVFFCFSCLLSKWMVRPLERAWAQQRQFVGDASHELKTPLTVILTNAELLESDVYDPASRQRFTQSILTTAQQMKELVENLLELARMDHDARHQRQQHQNVDLSYLAEECVLRFEPVYFEAGRSLESQVQPGLQVKGLARSLRQVVDILLDNGSKYSRPGSQVVLTLEQNRNHALLKVTSMGESLNAEQCEDIFKRFYRVDEVRTMSRSYGLGLPIAQGIVRDHRGKIWCQSKNGVNTFLVSLPLHHTK